MRYGLIDGYTLNNYNNNGVRRTNSPMQSPRKNSPRTKSRTNSPRTKSRTNSPRQSPRTNSPRQKVSGSCLLPRGYELGNVRGDGRCLFRSLVQAERNARDKELLPYEKETKEADVLRNKIVDVIAKGKKQYEDRWWIYAMGEIRRPNGREEAISYDHKTYMNKMRKPGEYGGDLEIMIAAKLLNREICVTSASRGGTTTQQYGRIDSRRVDPTRKKLYLYLYGEHYTPYLRYVPERQSVVTGRPSATRRPNANVRSNAQSIRRPNARPNARPNVRPRKSSVAKLLRRRFRAAFSR